ncbi:Low temperature requirement protein LtrA [Sphingopyxis sp. YR583]|jgi:low temperature requirement protein LtrA|uniref:low temperature requirement protein A n=1 Tax=Sphingopyxis sp. YR583 TaxID=1881047 RepID=UPI0008A7EBFC|nr:low temperature requirement protein A [Sphingopyxis sp. YR583]SEH17293.1 Low temperature requirement protein LtrA [Sphingopyxis sp. YR583]
MTATRRSILRNRDGHHARVTYEELFFDLVYVFAVTQLSHLLLHHLSPVGALETLILWFAVWLGWQYTCWVTNWFDPENPRLRGVLFVLMLLALMMAAAIPEAFGDRGLVFAACYVTLQLGRTLFVIFHLDRGTPLAANYRRMAAWFTLSGCFWIAGAFAGHEGRLALWGIAVLLEYVAPMTGFAFPGLGRSQTSEWTIEGGHLAERCQLFVIVALGETLLATGATLGRDQSWSTPILSALGATFLGTLALWWLYFGTSSKDATAKITTSDDPGRIGAWFNYVHAILVGGIIVCAVGNDLAMEHPGGHASLPQVLVIAAGPILYLAGSAIYRRVVYGRVPASHLAGILAALALAPIGLNANLLTMGWCTTLLLAAVAIWESQTRRTAPAIAGR